MAILRIQTVYCVASETEAARSFYENVLGLPLKFADAPRWVQFNVAGANFAVAAIDEAPGLTQGTVAVFEVDDLDELKKTLAAAGGPIFAERDMGPHGRTLAAKDPAGNVLQFFQSARGR